MFRGLFGRSTKETTITEDDKGSLKNLGKRSMDEAQNKFQFNHLKEKLLEFYVPEDKLHLFDKVCWIICRIIEKNRGKDGSIFNSAYSLLESIVPEIINGAEFTEEQLNDRFDKIFIDDMNKKTEIIIPDKYITALKNIITEYETETKRKCQIEINIYGHREAKTVLGDFSKRTGLRVTKIIPGGEELIGEYNSFEELQNKIKYLSAKTCYYDVKYDSATGKSSGKCRKCDKFNEQIGHYGSCCDCGNWDRSVWSNVHIGHDDGTIYRSSGGSIATLNRIGEFEFV